MKIATWNVERPKAKVNSKNTNILKIIKELDADILVLTETNSFIDAGEGFEGFATTPSLPDETFIGLNYFSTGENRVTIWSTYPFIKQYPTFNANISICIEFTDLIVYGTIIGTLGNRNKSFIPDLKSQIVDWGKIILMGKPVCIIGDFNISFSDNYYYTKEGRGLITDFINTNDLMNVTEYVPQNIDHIVLSKSFPKLNERSITTWNFDKKLSDHLGVCVSFSA